MKLLGEDTVARRIVMNRSTWDALVDMSSRFEAIRDVETSAGEVAKLALEAGLEVIRRGLEGTPAPEAGELTTPAALVAAQVVAPAAPAATKSKSKSGKRKRAPSGKQRRQPPLELSAGEQQELKELLSSQRSVRARQRTIALWLGHRRPTIRTEWLRQLAIEHEAYNVANFAQNMKKDGQFFSERRSKQRRTGWRLTEAGVVEIERRLQQVSLAA